uniref:Uncharacterized protein n=1 Tax=Oryza sativa subsp. japonica TaxID=39947 RepID=Q6Z3N1_ORYSJ|nr:hypothetical protein [Oryza sativa Japonica Group]BAD05565.1 hypothetical protein [Oryza sativa Japonica Group]
MGYGWSSKIERGDQRDLTYQLDFDAAAYGGEVGGERADPGDRGSRRRRVGHNQGLRAEAEQPRAVVAVIVGSPPSSSP